MVFRFVTLFDVVEVLAALRDEGEKAAAGRKVLLMNLEMLSEAEDPLGHHRGLIRGATGISFVELVVFQVDLLGCAIGIAHNIRDESSRGRTVLG